VSRDSPGGAADPAASAPAPPRAPDRRLLAGVAVLYAAEGLPFGVIHELVPVWLKVQGSSLAELGLLSLVGLPWTLKPLWAPVVDRHGLARDWIGGMLLGIGVLCALTPLVPGGPVLWAVLLLMAFASATQDVAIDGWATSTLPERLHGRANGVRVAAYRAAMLLAGALGAWLPWEGLFLAVGLVALGLAAWTRSLPATRVPPAPARAWWGELWAWLSQPGSLAVLLFVLLFKLGDAAMGPMVKPFWLDQGLGVEEVGFISITLGTALGVGGALVGGEVASRVGLFRALWSLGALQALSNLGYVLAALLGGRAAVYGASVGESFTSGLGTAAYLACLMRLCERDQAATRFAVLTALAGLTRTLAGAISGLAVEEIGYAAWFALSFLLALPAFALLPWVRERVGEG
jgi:MFS transporter, PAT family, beta-lactamase induction signal transducer AmpG